ncbi:hypothetical protein ACFZAG_39300 [Streptomyces sp. NPDC012403]|uniref:hypothetical protein n=1 Tax=Streptomyces sp. NPDC012403 TaxID=3364831 RepID=UPI0036E30C31
MSRSCGCGRAGNERPVFRVRTALPSCRRGLLVISADVVVPDLGPAVPSQRAGRSAPRPASVSFS